MAPQSSSDSLLLLVQLTENPDVAECRFWALTYRENLDHDEGLCK